MHQRKYKPPRYRQYSGRPSMKQPVIAAAPPTSSGMPQARSAGSSSRALRPRDRNVSRCPMHETIAKIAGKASHQTLLGRRYQMSIKTTVVNPNASAISNAFRNGPTALSYVGHTMTDTAAIRAGEELNTSTLAAYLRDKLEGADRGISIEQFPGGHSNLTYLIHTWSREYVLRRPPMGPVAPKAHDMAREHTLLKAVHPVFPPAPAGFHLCCA